MRSFKLLLLFSAALLAPAALASAQDTDGLDNEALLNRVTKEIDALVLAGDKARTGREAVEEAAASLTEAQAAANAPLPAEQLRISIRNPGLESKTEALA